MNRRRLLLLAFTAGAALLVLLVLGGARLTAARAAAHMAPPTRVVPASETQVHASEPTDLILPHDNSVKVTTAAISHFLDFPMSLLYFFRLSMATDA